MTNLNWLKKASTVIRSILILLCLVSSHFLLSQSSSTDFFNSVIKTTQDQFITIPSTDFELLNRFHIDELQFRTQTDEFDLERQEYTLRLRPGNFRIADHQKELIKAYEQKARLSNQENKEEQLISAYTIWTNHQIYKAELALKKNKVSLLNDKLKVYNKQLDLPNFNIIRYIETEDAVNNIEIDIQKLTWKIANQEQNIYPNKEMADDNSIDAILSIEDIITLVNKGEQVIYEDDLAKRLLALDQLIMQKEIAMENAETKQILDFVQVRYGGPHDDLFNEKVSVGVGINLPTKSRNKIKINELLLEQKDDEIQYQKDIEDQKVEATIAYEALIEELKLYQLILSQNENSILKNKTIKDRIESSAASSPIDLLDIKLLEHEKIERLFELEKDVFQAYLDWLEASGLMNALPLKNYLTKNLEPLSYDPDFW